jgi:4,4'-diaponeurosporenoate glycosyltransferase
VARIAQAVTAQPDVVTSIQPWHKTGSWGEQASVLCNVTALMGCGAFNPARRNAKAQVAFGPILAVDRTTYDRVGGHAAPSVRSMHTEDIGLARLVGGAELYTGRPDTSFQMYPEGLRQTIRGWTRSIATGARFTSCWIAIATLAWVWSLAGGWITMPIVFPLSALQFWILGRRAASIHPLTVLLYPLAVLAFIVIFLRSLVALIFGRRVEWKGRDVDAR